MANPSCHSLVVRKHKWPSASRAIFIEFDFYQLVIVEGLVRRLDDRLAQAVLPDQDNRLELVRQPFEIFFLFAV